MITFHSVDSDGNKVIFSENYSRKDNIIIFNDKTCPNTQIEITINDDMVITLYPTNEMKTFRSDKMTKVPDQFLIYIRNI